MSKSSAALAGAPAQSLQALEALGRRLRAHRQRQSLTLDELAARLFCSPATLRALESGKPGTSIGMLAHALWLLGELDSLDDVAGMDSSFAAVTGKRVRRRAGVPARGAISEGERDF